jgi:hypothetical protein
MCKTLCPTGLLFILLMDEQWASFPANISFDAQGIVIIAPRYAPQAYVLLNDQMSNVALLVSRTSNEQTLEWISAEETLKTAIVKSLGLKVQ